MRRPKVSAGLAQAVGCEPRGSLDPGKKNESPPDFFFLPHTRVNTGKKRISAGQPPRARPWTPRRSSPGPLAVAARRGCSPSQLTWGVRRMQLRRAGRVSLPLVAAPPGEGSSIVAVRHHSSPRARRSTARPCSSVAAAHHC